jgi:hypothetical protein
MGFWLTQATQSNTTVTQSSYEFFVTRLLPGHSTIEGHLTVTGSRFWFSLPKHNLATVRVFHCPD